MSDCYSLDLSKRSRELMQSSAVILPGGAGGGGLLDCWYLNPAWWGYPIVVGGRRAEEFRRGTRTRLTRTRLTRTGVGGSHKRLVCGER